jgi:hypothetical protein
MKNQLQISRFHGRVLHPGELRLKLAKGIEALPMERLASVLQGSKAFAETINFTRM